MTCLTVDEFESIQKHLEVFETLSNWIRRYLAEPHRDLGRTGTVCPYAPAALRHDAIRLAVVTFGTADHFKRICESVIQYKRVFQELREENESNRVLQAIIIGFPDVAASDAAPLIDQAQKLLKPEFVRSGLMLGEFHGRNNTPGLHNGAFRPLRSPVPLLAIRHMVPSDIVFLCRPEDPATLRAEYLDAYLACQQSLTAGERLHAESLLHLARAEGDAASHHHG
jgi:Domain of unknown function (DUF6875)